MGAPPPPQQQQHQQQQHQQQQQQARPPMATNGRSGARPGGADLPARMEGMSLGVRGRRRGDMIHEYAPVRTMPDDRQQGDLKYGTFII